MTNKINGWGLIGTGRIADDRILPGINAVAGNKLVAVVSREQARADIFAKKFGAQHAYTSYDEMLRNPDVTVVAIETPSALHAEQAIAAARAGKHVFCDKPMSTNVADAERVVRELVENRMAFVAAESVAKAAPDGYTLLIGDGQGYQDVGIKADKRLVSAVAVWRLMVDVMLMLYPARRLLTLGRRWSATHRSSSPSSLNPTLPS